MTSKSSEMSDSARKVMSQMAMRQQEAKTTQQRETFSGVVGLLIKLLLPIAHCVIGSFFIIK